MSRRSKAWLAARWMARLRQAANDVIEHADEADRVTQLEEEKAALEAKAAADKAALEAQLAAEAQARADAMAAAEAKRIADAAAAAAQLQAEKEALAAETARLAAEAEAQRIAAAEEAARIEAEAAARLAAEKAALEQAMAQKAAEQAAAMAQQEAEAQAALAAEKAALETKMAQAATNAAATYLPKTGKAVDADKLDGYDWMQNGKNIRGTNIYADDWFRNYNSGEGLYNEATGAHWVSDANARWTMRDSASTIEMRLATNGTSTRGYVYADSGNNIGFLDKSHNWRLKVNTSGVDIIGDLLVNGAPLKVSSSGFTGLRTTANGTLELYKASDNESVSADDFGDWFSQDLDLSVDSNGHLILTV